LGVRIENFNVALATCPQLLALHAHGIELVRFDQSSYIHFSFSRYGAKT
jgi:hypothetical protein